MNNNNTFHQHLWEELQDPEFKQLWLESEAEYQLARQIIKTREKLKFSQRQLAQKVGTSQAMISKIETSQANPSLGLMKRIAQALGTELMIGLKLPS